VKNESTRAQATNNPRRHKWTAELREKYLADHPVKNAAFVMHTPMFERAYSIVKDRVDTARTGTYFFGFPRLGKTSCAEEIKELLKDDFPSVYTSIVPIWSVSHVSDSHLFKLILEAEKHVLVRRPDPHLLLMNLITDIKMKVATRKGKQFVFMPDEFHLLNHHDFRQLLALHNALEKDGIKMTTIAFAQPEILSVVTSLQAAHQAQIIARFLSEPVKFEGCANLEELIILLKLYDEDSEFPNHTGISYTHFFFPLAYAQGFRMTDCADLLWKILAKNFPAHTEYGIPMEHLCLTVQHLLVANRKSDVSNFCFGEEDIDRAVLASNLLNFTSQVLPSLS